MWIISPGVFFPTLTSPNTFYGERFSLHVVFETEAFLENEETEKERERETTSKPGKGLEKWHGW